MIINMRAKIHCRSGFNFAGVNVCVLHLLSQTIYVINYLRLPPVGWDVQYTRKSHFAIASPGKTRNS